MVKRLKLISITRILLIALSLIPIIAGCGPMFGPRGRMGPGMMGPWGMGWFGIIFIVLLFVIVAAAALIFLLSRLKQSYKIGGLEESNGNSKALEILKERHARGEIDKAEFDEIKKDL